MVAIVADTAFGGTSLSVVAIGIVVVWLIYRLLGGVANWRWDAWDEQEREQFRQSIGGAQAVRPRPWGRPIDLLVIGLVGAAALTLALAIGGTFRSDAAVPLAFGVAAGLVLIAGLFGAAQDALNSRAGLRPQEITPLPTAS